MIKWLGHATQTTASVIVRDTSNGAATLACNGVTYEETVDTSVSDGLVRFDVSGLTAGKSYDYSVTVPSGGSDTGILKTQGDGVVRVGWKSCSSMDGDGAGYIMPDYGLDACVTLGDEGYYEATTTVDLASATDPAVYNAATLRVRSATSEQNLITQVPFYGVHDDHDNGGNDLRWKLAQFQLTFGAYVTSEDDMRDIIDAASESTEHYFMGNPANTDAGIDTGAFYHRFDLGNHAEVFVLSAVIWGRDPTDTNRLMRPDYGASNAMLGAKQIAWLKARLAASTKTYKIIMCPKMTLTAEFTNPDGYNAYFEEFDLDIAPFIHAGSGWAVPGGVIWCTGDYHTPSVHAAYNGVDGATYDHVEVCACPCQKDQDIGVRDSGVGGAYTVQWLNTGQGDSAVANRVTATHTYPEARNFGLIEVAADGSYLEAKIIFLNGHEWWSGRVLPGDNKLTYPAKPFSIS